MSQDQLTPTPTMLRLAEFFYLEALKLIPLRARCAYCVVNRWFAVNPHNGLKLCKYCWNYELD